MFMLIDCDNFFVSCERIFQPRLKKSPVIVLSNNDGCVVSRSYEAKNLGIPMGCPYFKIERQFTAAGGIALSSNYELYADISSRMMSFLYNQGAKVEPYSIDEAFLEIGSGVDSLSLARNLHQSIQKQIGIPVSIGIARTKTLCKIAGAAAKKNEKVFSLLDSPSIAAILAHTDVIDIWGIGRHIAPKLNYIGIFTGADLAQSSLGMIRQSFGINLEKTVLELNQKPCLGLQEQETQKSIISSRSFEFEIKDKVRLTQIISEFVDDACRRLRKQKAAARGIMVELETNRFNPKIPHYHSSRLVSLEAPSDNTSRFMSAMIKGLDLVYHPELAYKRAGIILTGIENWQHIQPDLLQNQAPCLKEQKLMQAFDSLNKNLGRKTIFFASQAAQTKPFLRREFKSPAYTTSWSSLPLVRG